MRTHVEKIDSPNEWGRLREIVVGRATNSFVPPYDLSWSNFDRPTPKSRREIKAGKMPKKLKAPHFEAQPESGINLRDLTLIIGKLVIETPSPTRGRYFESFNLRDLFDDYRARHNSVWFVSPPRPRLLDSTYNLKKSCALGNHEPLFDAANCVRLGADIIIDINNTANEAGAQWLEQTLKIYYGPQARAHRVNYSPDHIDVVLVPLREGCFLVNPAYASWETLPGKFRGWDCIFPERIVPQKYELCVPKASNWIGMNVIVIDGDDGALLVEERQLPLIRQLERHKFRPIPVRWRHGRDWGGGFHCVTLDLHRDGKI
jgi:N-dimethylarginine dimethylaminohydrolase